MLWLMLSLFLSRIYNIAELLDCFVNKILNENNNNKSIVWLLKLLLKINGVVTLVKFK